MGPDCTHYPFSPLEESGPDGYDLETKVPPLDDEKEHTPKKDHTTVSLGRLFSFK